MHGGQNSGGQGQQQPKASAVEGKSQRVRVARGDQVGDRVMQTDRLPRSPCRTPFQ